MRDRYIDDIPSEWLERCLAVMALDPATAGDQGDPLHVEHANGETDLCCETCGATWLGIPGEDCWWCWRAEQIQLEHQADLLLQPPDVDPDDINYEPRMAAWAERLARGVETGLITERQAIAATRAADRRVA